MVESKEFHLSDILTITSGVLLSIQMKGVYGILNYMTGDSVYTHQIPRVSKECAPRLLGLYPWLADIKVSHLNRDNISEWFEKEWPTLVEKYGEYHKVYPLHFDDHEYIDPVEEIETMCPGKVIKVRLDSS